MELNKVIEIGNDVVNSSNKDLVDARDFLIGEFDKTKEIIQKVIDKIENDPAYRELKKKDIKLIIYNNRKKVVNDNLLYDDIEV